MEAIPSSVKICSTSALEKSRINFLGKVFSASLKVLIFWVSKELNLNLNSLSSLSHYIMYSHYSRLYVLWYQAQFIGAIVHVD